MRWWNRSPDPSEADDLKRQTHQSAERADKNIQRLNKLLLSNGITLKIYKATHGHHHAK